MKREFKDVDDAKSFIEDTLADWITSDGDSKIISLAQFVDRWSHKGGGPKAKQKSISKDIKAYALMISRAKVRGEDVNTLEAMQSDLKTELDKLVVETEGIKRDVNTGTITTKKIK